MVRLGSPMASFAYAGRPETGLASTSAFSVRASYLWFFAFLVLKFDN